MRTKILLYLFLIIATVVQAQDKVLDSLQNELKKAKNDIDKTIVLNAIADQYKYSDPTKMAEYGNQALQLAKKIKYKVEEGNAYLNIGTSNIILGDYKKALDNFILAKDIFEENNTSSTKKEVAQGLAKAYGSMGIVFSEQSNYAKALEFYLKSVKIYESLKDESKCSKIYNNIGVVYKSQNSDFKALEYFIKAQKIQDKLQDVNVGITLTNIANIYLKQKSLDKASEYYTLAKKALEKNPNPRALGEWYNNMGLYYVEKNQDNEAISSWNNSIKTFQSIDDKFGLADTYIFLGQFYLAKNQLDEAFQNTNKALTLATEINVLEQKAVSEKLLSEIYAKKGNSNLALEHFQKYSVAKDSLTNEENIRRSVEASMNYEFEKKELLQKEENDKRELLLKEEAKSSKLKLIFGALIALLLFGIGFLIYNRTQLKKTLTLQKELAEYEQKALHLQMNPHFVFNCLGSISSFIVQNGTDSAIKYLSKFSKLMRLTLEYSKESLIPIDKEIESLQNYLELEQLRFNHKFNFNIQKSADIEDDVALPPLLIQPFVENAIIHGVIPKKEMGNITIDFSIKDDSLICTILDDGIGINQSKLNKENSVVAHKSMALDIITKRLEMIASSTSKKATIEIEELTEENKITGTKVILHLPLQYIV
ncbi:tetratricopeptide repeat protein [Flavobacterium gelidilacus]|uniref:tetratricopeptide repeat protein n=1 Tax=Flavobacterium gelidilacus TaxID=206041 RepID=UPI0003FB43DD|nr:tetratricopeptide repeat protein [Flavobacterium gelidilacus]